MRPLTILILLGAVALAQEPGDRVTVPFTDPSRPKTLKAHLMNGCFAIEGYEGKDVIVETKAGTDNARQRVPHGAEGMKRIDPSGSGLTIEEENNTVRISGPSVRASNIVVRVPRDIALNVQCMNGGDLKVNGVSGDLELNNTNGSVSATSVSGSVLAHSLNGKVTVALDRVTANKPMSFSTLNGDIDVTLPAGTAATLRMKSDNGEVFTDFDVKLSPNANQPVVEDNRGKNGKYRVRMDKGAVGTVNGGGPEMSFKTLNGNIFVRQRK